MANMNCIICIRKFVMSNKRYNRVQLDSTIRRAEYTPRQALTDLSFQLPESKDNQFICEACAVLLRKIQKGREDIISAYDELVRAVHSRKTTKNACLAPTEENVLLLALRKGFNDELIFSSACSAEQDSVSIQPTKHGRQAAQHKLKNQDGKFIRGDENGQNIGPDWWKRGTKNSKKLDDVLHLAFRSMHQGEFVTGFRILGKMPGPPRKSFRQALEELIEAEVLSTIFKKEPMYREHPLTALENYQWPKVLGRYKTEMPLLSGCMNAALTTRLGERDSKLSKSVIPALGALLSVISFIVEPFRYEVFQIKVLEEWLNNWKRKMETVTVQVKKEDNKSEEILPSYHENCDYESESDPGSAQVSETTSISEQDFESTDPCVVGCSTGSSGVLSQSEAEQTRPSSADKRVPIQYVVKTEREVRQKVTSPKKGVKRKRLNFESGDSAIQDGEKMVKEQEKEVALPQNLSMVMYAQDGESVGGVWSSEFIAKDKEFGPYKDLSTSNDGCGPEQVADWIRVMRRSDDKDEHNMVALRSGADIYYRTCTDIEPGEELVCCQIVQESQLPQGASKSQSSQDHTYFTGGNVENNKNQVYVCPISMCGESFSWQKALKAHMTTHKQIDSAYHCEECGQNFTWASTYKSHLETHQDGKPYKCTECGQSFYWANTLKSHMKSHAPEKTYPCADCDQIFPNESLYKIHRVIHTGEKLYVCGDCGKGFAKARNAREHQKVHMDDKPFDCELCDSTFKRKANLRAHMRIHTGEKPFVCHCGKAFAHPGPLKKHKESHLTEDTAAAEQGAS